MTVDCPKRMVHGPCGGVRADGSCEMQPMPCVFPNVTPWTADTVAHDNTTSTAPVVLTDLSAPPFAPFTLRAVADRLRDSCDAVLVGDHQDRVDAPPHELARWIADAGLQPWVTLACRDRNRLVLEQELRTLALDGLATVLCVTGDGRAYDVRSDVTQVFDLDGTRLAALAAGLGVRAAVVETPTAPPRNQRPLRTVQKQRAGASAVVLNHVSAVAGVAEFVGSARDLGLEIPVVASVVVYTDARSVAALQGLPGITLDSDDTAAVLGADDGVEAGIVSATRRAAALLAVHGVDGVNLSGLASADGPEAAAEVFAEVGRRVRSGLVRT